MLPWAHAWRNADCAGWRRPADSRRVFFHNGISHNNSAVRGAHIRDGMTNVILLGETKYAPHRGSHDAYTSWDTGLRVYGNGGEYAFPSGLCATMEAINSSDFNPATDGWPAHVCTSTFGSAHTGGCYFAMAVTARTRGAASWGGRSNCG